MKFATLLFLATNLVQAASSVSAPPFLFQYNDTRWEQAPAGRTDTESSTQTKTLFTLQSKQSEEKYRSRFSIVEDKPVQKAGLSEFESYRAHAVDFLKGQRFSIQSVESIKLKHLEVPAIEIRANQRDFGLTFRQVIFLYQQKAYLVTGSSRTKSFATTDVDFQEMFDSLTLSSLKQG